MLSRFSWTLLLIGTLLATPLRGEDKKKLEGLPRKTIDGDNFEVGGIVVNAKRKTVSFPASVNMTSGLLEYLIVSEGGKTHESLLVTKIDPVNLHAVMLLLGAKGVLPPETSAPSSVISSAALAAAPVLKGDGIEISVSWSSGTTQHLVPAEDLIYNLKTQASMSHGEWIYNGSYFSDGQFVAQEQGSFAALVNDPDALINNPRPGHDDDQIWSPNSKEIMPVKTPVQVTITILSPASPSHPTP